MPHSLPHKANGARRLPRGSAGEYAGHAIVGLEGNLSDAPLRCAQTVCIHVLFGQHPLTNLASHAYPEGDIW